MQQQPSSISSSSLCLWREEARISSPTAKVQGRVELVFRRFFSPTPYQMRNEVADSHSADLQRIFSDHLAYKFT